MSKIGFLTDSCSDIPQELADKYGIEVPAADGDVPLQGAYQ